jgi:hypothetical protein
VDRVVQFLSSTIGYAALYYMVMRALWPGGSKPAAGIPQALLWGLITAGLAARRQQDKPQHQQPSRGRRIGSPGWRCSGGRSRSVQVGPWMPRAPSFAPANKSDGLAYFNGISEGYFATLHTALRAGRDITPGDVQDGRRVAVINEAMARRVFGSSSPPRGCGLFTRDGLGAGLCAPSLSAGRFPRWLQLHPDVR